MSVVGFDFGTRNSVIAVAQKGGIDVIVNDVSNRQTPSMVTFGEKERYIGESASTQWLRSVKNTITDIKRIIGLGYNEADVQAEGKRNPYKLVPLENNRVGVEVMYRNDQRVFSTETVAGMLFNKLKQITEAAINTKVKDVVISVPGYWTDAQRRALSDAALIGGLNVLRFLNELTASALSYGIYKTDLPEKEKDPLKVLIIDMGEANFSAGVVDFHKGQLKVVSAVYDRNLGGRNFDDVLVEHFAKEFKTKYKIDVYENAKALLRLRVSCEKVKKTLSSNPEAPINIDNLMNDIDVKSSMDRKTFEELSSGLLERVCVPVKQALEEAKVKPDQLFAVEITGGATRLGSIQKKLNEFLGREVDKHLNNEESVARGCALQCAMLSPVFKVREFSVVDITQFPIQLSWKYLGGEHASDSAEVFSKNNVIPSSKIITFSHSKGVELVAEYLPHPQLPAGTQTTIGKFQVLNTVENNKEAKIKVRVKLDLNGVLSVVNAELVETLPETEDTSAPSTPSVPSPAPPATPSTEATAGSEDSKESSEAESTPKVSEEKKEEETKKRKVKRTAIDVTSSTPNMNPAHLQKAIEEEVSMNNADLEAVETANFKNAVESYVYDNRADICGGDLASFATEGEKGAFQTLADETESWLYGEGEDVPKAEYKKKLDALSKIGDPIKNRRRESELRPDAIKALVESVLHWQNEASSTDAKYEHIEKAEKDKVLAEVNAAREWLQLNRGKQDSLPAHANPVLLEVDILSRKSNLEKVAKTVMNKPKPKPKPVETPKPAPTPAEAKPAADAPASPAPTPATPASPAQEERKEPSSQMDID